MAKKEIQLEEDIIDLTELIESGDRGDGRGSAPAAADPGEDDEDFAAILAETTGQPSGHKVDPDEQLDMSGMGGIDNLLESLDIPPQPKGSAPKGAPAGDDLDNVLDDLLGEKPEAAPKAPPADDDLGDLLGDLDMPAQKPAPKPAPEPEPAESADAAQPAAMAGLDSDLDDILASFDTAPPKKAAAPQPADEPSLAADLDDILGEVELPTPPEPAPQPEPEIPVKAESLKAPVEDLAEDLSLLEEPAQTQQAQAEAHAVELPDELDAMLDEEAPVTSPAPAGPQAGSKAAEPAGHDSGHALMPAQIQPWSPEALVGICRNLANLQDEGARQSLQEFARELGQQTAHVEDMGDELGQLGKRLLACESKLSASRARIAGLEKAMESTTALGDLLQAGSPLHAGFMALISTAVSNALKGFTPKSGPDPQIQAQIEELQASFSAAKMKIAALEQRLDKIGQPEGEEEEMARLIAAVDNSGEKIKALEKKMAAMNQQFEAGMEKAAAATVAKVLHEEISRLAQE